VNLALDHIVVAARRLDDGVAWCESLLGITPGPGGQHVFMGTHNRLFRIESPTFPRAYLEIIAIDPDLATPIRPRWFDLDQPALQAELERGPRLLHWVARTGNLAHAVDTAAAAGIDCGEILHAQRATARGTLAWRITVRPDGRCLFAGALPTLIEWPPGTHPVDAMSPSGVQLQGMELNGLPPAVRSWLPAGVDWMPSSGTRPIAPMAITLASPRGRVRLDRSRCGRSFRGCAEPSERAFGALHARTHRSIARSRSRCLR